MKKIMIYILLITLVITVFTGCDNKNGAVLNEDLNKLYINTLFKDINWNSTEAEIEEVFKGKEPVIKEHRVKNTDAIIDKYIHNINKNIIYDEIEILGEQAKVVFTFNTTTLNLGYSIDLGLTNVNIQFNDKEKGLAFINKHFDNEMKNVDPNDQKGYIGTTISKYTDYSKLSDEAIKNDKAALSRILVQDEKNTDEYTSYKIDDEEYSNMPIISIGYMIIDENNTFNITLNANNYKRIEFNNK